MTFANERTLLAWESACDAGAKQAFRWAGQAGLIERHHPILDTKNQQPRRGEAHYFETWADVEALADEIDPRYGALIIFAAGPACAPASGSRSNAVTST